MAHTCVTLSFKIVFPFPVAWRFVVLRTAAAYSNFGAIEIVRMLWGMLYTSLQLVFRFM